MTKTSTVIGANGFVGRALVDALKKQKQKVIAVERTSAKQQNGLLRGNIETPTFAKRIAKNADVIYYLAAKKSNIAQHTAHAYAYYEGNIRPLLRFLNAIRTLPPKTIVYTSSVLASYASDPDAADGYLQGKLACELALKAFAAETGWKLVIVRIAAVYGPGQDTNLKTANFLGSMMHKIRESKETLEIWGTGKRKLQFIHVDDLVANLVAAPKAKGNLFTIGHPESISLINAAKLLMRIMNKNLNMTHDLTKPDKPTKLFQFTNIVAPKKNLERGLKTMLK